VKLGLEARFVTPGQFLDDHEADVVAVASVLAPRIAQAGDE
jgi:hypothetical protein